MRNRSESGLPRVQDVCAAEGEVLGVAGDNGHAMHQRGCCDQGIALVAAVEHMQAGAASGNGTINRQNATCKSGQNMRFKPVSQRVRLARGRAAPGAGCRFQVQAR